MQNIYAQNKMDSDTLFKKRILDLADRAYTQHTYTYTNFLSLPEQDLLLRMRSELSFIDFSLYGGTDTSERCIACFGSPSDFGYEASFPIKIIKITPLLEKFSDDFTHRDFLGAIMNLSIERDVIGDIVIKNKSGYVFCLDTISRYISENLQKIKHTCVRCEAAEGEIPELLPTLSEITVIAASQRADAVVAGLLKLSRSRSVEMFREKLIFINGKQCENNSRLLKPDDILVIRGSGKYVFVKEGAETRKGRLYLTLKKYI